MADPTLQLRAVLMSAFARNSFEHAGVYFEPQNVRGIHVRTYLILGDIFERLLRGIAVEETDESQPLAFRQVWLTSNHANAAHLREHQERLASVELSTAKTSVQYIAIANLI